MDCVALAAGTVFLILPLESWSKKEVQVEPSLGAGHRIFFSPANFMERSTETSLQSIYNRVTMLAKKRIAGFSRSTELDFRESYLFRNNHICGVKITAGPFIAKWCESNEEIEFFRGQTPLGSVSIHGDHGKQAA